jgi:hypothetical protein
VLSAADFRSAVMSLSVLVLESATVTQVIKQAVLGLVGELREHLTRDEKEHPIVLCERFNTGGDVENIPDRPVVKILRRSDVPNQGMIGVQSDAKPEQLADLRFEALT